MALCNFAGQRLDLPNGTQTAQSYDALQRLTQVVNKKTGGADLNKFAYAYDNRDVRTAVQQKYGSDPLRQVNYSYDAVDQLVGEAATGGVAGSNYSNAYSYDAMGNRLRRENTQGTTTAMTRSGVNELNQLTSVSTSIDGGPRVTGGMNYDAAGNLTETSSADGSRTLYVYDDADRLFRIEKRNAADAPLSKSEFIYDYASRKSVSQEFTYTAGAWVQNSEKRRVFDGLDVIQERDENNQVTAQLVRDGNIAGILSRSTAAGASFFSYDGAGNVSLLTDTNGNEVGRYRYDAFGNTLEIAGTRAAENPYRFSTKELHAASGLYDFGFRFYSALLGRWINRDPIREAGGLNLYAMVHNNPINAVDFYGFSEDVGGPDGTVRYSFASYIPYGQVSSPFGTFRGDGRGPSYNSKRYRTQINWRLDLKTQKITFFTPTVGLTSGIGGPASKYSGRASYTPRCQAFKTSTGYRININGTSYNPFYPKAFSPIAHNIIFDLDNNGNVINVHGVRSAFPSLELWVYRGNSHHQGYNFDVNALGRTDPKWLLLQYERFGSPR